MKIKQRGINLSVYLSRELAGEVRDGLRNGNFSALVCALLRAWLDKKVEVKIDDK